MWDSVVKLKFNWMVAICGVDLQTSDLGPLNKLSTLSTANNASLSWNGEKHNISYL